MDSTPPNTSPVHLRLVHSTDDPFFDEFVYLLEEIDVRDALPLLRALARRSRKAANSTLQLVTVTGFDNTTSPVSPPAASTPECNSHES